MGVFSNPASIFIFIFFLAFLLMENRKNAPFFTVSFQSNPYTKVGPSSNGGWDGGRKIMMAVTLPVIFYSDQ